MRRKPRTFGLAASRSSSAGKSRLSGRQEEIAAITLPPSPVTKSVSRSISASATSTSMWSACAIPAVAASRAYVSRWKLRFSAGTPSSQG